MPLYECKAHGRRDEVAQEACPECFAAQRAHGATKEQKVGFRRIDPEHLERRAMVAIAEGAKEPIATPEHANGEAQGASRNVNYLSIPKDAIAGPRVAGIDPGSHYVSVTIAEPVGDAIRWVASRTFHVGHAVERKGKRNDEDRNASGEHGPEDSARSVQDEAQGAEGAQSMVAPEKRNLAARGRGVRWVVDDSDVQKTLAEVVSYVAEHEATRVCVERSKMLYLGSEPTGGAVAGLAVAMFTSQWVGGILFGALLGAGVPMTSCSAAEWRRCFKRPKGQSWADALRVRYAGTLPPVLMHHDENAPHAGDTIGEHDLDSAGVLAFLFAVPKEAHAASAPKEAAPVRKVGGHARRDEAARKKREESGCNCNGKRFHAKTCPCYVPQKAGPYNKKNQSEEAPNLDSSASASSTEASTRPVP